MAHFTDIVEHSKDRLPLSEKRRVLKAIEQFIKIAGTNVEVSLAQVRATLQSAFETTALVNEAFSAWVELLNSVDKKKVGELIHHTFSIVAHKWNSFDLQTQNQARLVLEGMLEGHWAEILENVAILTDLSDIKELQHIGGVIYGEKQGLDLHVHLHAFAQRCKDDHIIVVRHALQELKNYLEEFQESIHENATGAQPLPAISELYRSLLDVIIRFKEQDELIVGLSTECIGILGCVDPNQVDTVREKRSVLVLSNFDDVPEVVDFIAHMLETVLVEAFRSAPNGRQQSYFAFVMQELLKLSGIRDALTQRARSSPPKAALARWSKIPESIQNTLTPYLNSKYSLTNASAAPALVPFPLSGTPPNHASWLRRFVFHLLHRAKGPIAERMFPVISRVIHSHDLSVASFMLPFAIQNVVAGGEGFEIDFIKEELSCILNFDLSGLSDDDVQNIKLCSEVSFLLDSNWRLIND
jgi:serine/threonine-protein kinase ATR